MTNSEKSDNRRALPDNGPGPTLHVDFLLPEGALAGAVHAAIDTFGAVNDLQNVRAATQQRPPLSWRVLREEDAGADAGRAQGTHAVMVPPLRMVSVPQLVTDVSRAAWVLQHLRRRADAGDYILGLGTGIWSLAKAGLLAERQEVPMQWLYQTGFASRYPDVIVAGDQALTVQGRILCGAAPSLAHELALKLLECAGFADLARAVKDKLVFNAERQQLAAHDTSRAHVSGITRDSPLYKAVRWLQGNFGRHAPIAGAAAEAAVSERTLNRLFQKHLGKSPHAYLAGIRAQRAQMWLEVTLRSVEEIAHDCGFADVSAFRRSFQKEVGITPMEYRTRYTARSSRARWRLDEDGETP